MVKNSFRAFSLILILTLVGCATIDDMTEDIKVQSYLKDEKRVDQEIQGSLGNWQNAPELVDVERKPTRKVYVLEVSKDADIVPDKTYVYESTVPKDSSPRAIQKKSKKKKKIIKKRKKLDIPSFDDGNYEYVDDMDDKPSVATSYVDYKVKKDDTLQKISKKFYDSYSKWPKIYEVNKEKIKNPDRIKPGIVIQIPME